MGKVSLFIKLSVAAIALFANAIFGANTDDNSASIIKLEDAFMRSINEQNAGHLFAETIMTLEQSGCGQQIFEVFLEKKPSTITNGFFYLTTLSLLLNKDVIFAKYRRSLNKYLYHFAWDIDTLRTFRFEIVKTGKFDAVLEYMCENFYEKLKTLTQESRENFPDIVNRIIYFSEKSTKILDRLSSDGALAFLDQIQHELNWTNTLKEVILLNDDECYKVVKYIFTKFNRTINIRKELLSMILDKSFIEAQDSNLGIIIDRVIAKNLLSNEEMNEIIDFVLVSHDNQLPSLTAKLILNINESLAIQILSKNMNAFVSMMTTDTPAAEYIISSAINSNNLKLATYLLSTTNILLKTSKHFYMNLFYDVRSAISGKIKENNVINFINFLLKTLSIKDEQGTYNDIKLSFFTTLIIYDRIESFFEKYGNVAEYKTNCSAFIDSMNYHILTSIKDLKLAGGVPLIQFLINTSNFFTLLNILLDKEFCKKEVDDAVLTDQFEILRRAIIIYQHSQGRNCIIEFIGKILKLTASKKQNQRLYMLLNIANKGAVENAIKSSIVWPKTEIKNLTLKKAIKLGLISEVNRILDLDKSSAQKNITINENGKQYSVDAISYALISFIKHVVKIEKSNKFEILVVSGWYANIFQRLIDSGATFDITSFGILLDYSNEPFNAKGGIRDFLTKSIMYLFRLKTPAGKFVIVEVLEDLVKNPEIATEKIDTMRDIATLIGSAVLNDCFRNELCEVIIKYILSKNNGQINDKLIDLFINDLNVNVLETVLVGNTYTSISDLVDCSIQLRRHELNCPCTTSEYKRKTSNTTKLNYCHNEVSISQLKENIISLREKLLSQNIDKSAAFSVKYFDNDIDISKKIKDSFSIHLLYFLEKQLDKLNAGEPAVNIATIVKLNNFASYNFSSNYNDNECKKTSISTLIFELSSIIGRSLTREQYSDVSQFLNNLYSVVSNYNRDSELYTTPAKTFLTMIIDNLKKIDNTSYGKIFDKTKKSRSTLGGACLNGINLCLQDLLTEILIESKQTNDNLLSSFIALDITTYIAQVFSDASVGQKKISDNFVAENAIFIEKLINSVIHNTLSINSKRIPFASNSLEIDVYDLFKEFFTVADTIIPTLDPILEKTRSYIEHYLTPNLYNKLCKFNEELILCTQGASTKFSKQNIFEYVWARKFSNEIDYFEIISAILSKNYSTSRAAAIDDYIMALENSINAEINTDIKLRGEDSLLEIIKRDQLSKLLTKDVEEISKLYYFVEKSIN